MDEIKVSAMVDRGIYNKEEKTECPKKTRSKNTYRRAEGVP